MALPTDPTRRTALKMVSYEELAKLEALGPPPTTAQDRMAIMKALFPTDWAERAALGALSSADQARLAALKRLSLADWSRLWVLKRLSPADQDTIKALGTISPADWARLAALETLSPKDILLSIVIVFLFYTLSNVAILCCLSSFLGALSRKSRFARNGQRAEEDMRSHFMGAVMRGFFVYIALLAGLLVFSGSQFADMDQERYIRLASMVSVFSFLIGHDPRLFDTLRSRFDDVLSARPQREAK
jgi:hypothetical protein